MSAMRSNNTVEADYLYCRPGLYQRWQDHWSRKDQNCTAFCASYERTALRHPCIITMLRNFAFMPVTTATQWTFFQCAQVPTLKTT